MKRLKFFVEEKAFGVCSFLGKRFGIPSRHIRLFFIYTTFIQVTSPVVVYMILAFWLNMKKFIRQAKSVVWD